MVKIIIGCLLGVNCAFSQQLFRIDPTDTNGLQVVSNTLNTNCRNVSVSDPGVYSAELYQFRSFLLFGLMKNRDNFHVCEYEIPPAFLGKLMISEGIEQRIRNFILYDASYNGEDVDESHAFYLYALLNMFVEKRIVIHSRIGKYALGSGDFFKEYVKKRKADDTNLCSSMDSLFYRDEITEIFIPKWSKVRDRIKEIKVDTLTYEGILFTCMLEYYDKFRSIEDLESNYLFRQEINEHFHNRLHAISPNPFTLSFNSSFSEVSSNDSTFTIFVSFNSGKITDLLLVCMKKVTVRFRGDKDLERMFVNEDETEAVWYANPQDYKGKLYKYSIDCHNKQKQPVKTDPFQGLFIIDKIGSNKKVFDTWNLW